jgi:hypothetical protein
MRDIEKYRQRRGISEGRFSLEVAFKPKVGRGYAHILTE